MWLTCKGFREVDKHAASIDIPRGKISRENFDLGFASGIADHCSSLWQCGMEKDALYMIRRYGF